MGTRPRRRPQRDPESLPARNITALDPSSQLLEELQPLFEMLVPLNGQIEAADDRNSALEKRILPWSC